MGKIYDSKNTSLLGLGYYVQLLHAVLNERHKIISDLIFMFDKQTTCILTQLNVICELTVCVLYDHFIFGPSIFGPAQVMLITFSFQPG
jgi:hypothetical protein